MMFLGGIREIVKEFYYDLRTEADAPAGIGHENWKDMPQSSPLLCMNMDLLGC